MRLLCESEFRPVGGIIGVSFEGKWLKPVRPDDELQLETEVLSTRQSRSDQDRGFVTVQVSTRNQRAEVVQLSKFVLLVPARGGAAASN